ncbi:hypothetical protein QM467_00570 [Rhodoblastus sp. 17X3]|uniref:hypothetical protein n=1 Tax=Rhodoblastus sp. 17X3 TaxID=3047026 RepID=UPI0024B87340|nr:hypothetical protein [Rhodoblastus sp. 17X3]MDI9846544.1 hypothetical protein [Rhodoblastus sp. 17X3]
MKRLERAMNSPTPRTFIEFRPGMRRLIEDAIESLILLLDEIDGDDDFEEEPDREDDLDEEDESGIGDADGLAEQTGIINGADCAYVE